MLFQGTFLLMWARSEFQPGALPLPLPAGHSCQLPLLGSPRPWPLDVYFWAADAQKSR